MATATGSAAAAGESIRANSLRGILREGGVPRGKFVLAATLSAAAVLAGAALLGTSGYLISKAALQPPILTLTVAIVGVRAFGVARAVLRYSERIVTHDIALASLARLRSRFFARLVPLVPGGVRTGGADLLSAFVADVEALKDLYVRVLVPPPAALLASLAILIACLLLLPTVAAALCAGVMLSATLAPAWSAWLARSGAQRQAPARAELTGELIDAIDGGAELVTSGADAKLASQIEHSGERLRTIQMRDSFAGSAAVALSSLIGGLAVVAVLALAVSGSADGALPGVAIAVLLFLAMGVFEAVNPLNTAAQSAEHSRAAAGRIGDVLNRESPIVRVNEPLPIPSGGALELSGVSFSFGDGEPMLLRDADFVLKPGERVALTGPSGSGKSTIANLLVRFLDPVAGSVTLGGTDVRLLDADAVRRAVRLEGQAGFLFTTSIRENLLIAKPGADDADLTAILTRVGLGDWLASLPDGLETLVGEHGDNLSGGQRQRIAFARGLLAQSRFLILDEPTAQLDRENADALIDAIICDTPPATGVLVITHDDRSVGQFDRVLALKGGHLVSYP